MEPSDAADLVHRLLSMDSAAGELEELLTADADARAIDHVLASLRSAAPLRVDEILVNGARVDVVFESDGGQAWRAVVWTSGSPGRIDSVTVFPRPPVFAPVIPGTVVVLNGPSSVGKSSLMAAFAEAVDTPWACFDEPFLGRLPTRYLAWPETAGPQREGFLAALAGAARVGNQCLVSAAGMPQASFRDGLAGIATVSVGLHAPLDVLITRQLRQRDKFGGLAEESVGIHEGWVYDLEIDTTTRSPDQAARDLADFLAVSSRSQGDPAT